MANTLFLYTENVFDVANPIPAQVQVMQTDANTIGASGFTDLILSSFHVNGTGGLVYNNIALQDLYGDLPDMLAGIKQGGTVEHLLLSIGGGNGVSGHDYANILANESAFKGNLEFLMLKYHIDGVDFDLEVSTTDYTDLLIDLTGWLSGLGQRVTLPPCGSPCPDSTFWINVLEGTTVAGVQQVSHVNLQHSETPDYATWETTLASNATAIGVSASDVPLFLFPGYRADISTPSEVQSAVQSLKTAYPTLNGAMMWKYDVMSDGPKVYAEALAMALG